ncbi:group II intron reverse transcriptase/maturase [Anaerovorax sp. IOR16]|uniref:group II intron reverse transcriptase/maturase n=1 Tax=Anaerovorax sp. IOR16 TaxID=2773458 RepID=UPI001FD63B48|nr:group II intron reverse transcriptase/maturase [Anaerovorax sp. IOR16]
MSEENIKLAYRNLKTNKGSKTAGVDRKTIENLKRWNDQQLIANIVKSLEWYTPNKIRRVEIPKANGKTRPLGIPTIKDRLIQQCILQVLEPICEAKFHERSNGFRPNRSAEHAIAQAMAMIQQRNMHYVIDIDIKGFFDNVSHGKLLKQMWHLGIRDKKLIRIISTMLKAEVAGIGFPENGTPQGSLISPLLSNVVLNELDWWIASQWEEFPTEYQYKCCIHENGVANKSPIYSALRKTNLKECYIVRYADDFKIFCRTRDDAEKLFTATQKWLKERLGLEISPEKSKIVNLKRHYSEFLGFRLKAKIKGKKSDGQPKYVVTSHISEKAHKNILKRANETISEIAKHDDKETAYKYIGIYNSFVMGIHNYYNLATEVNKDFHKISFHVNRTLKRKLKNRLKRPDTSKLRCKAILKRYGKSMELRSVYNLPIIPIAYVQHKNPMWKRTSINKYTATGRAEIHKNLKGINMDILLYLMRNPIQNRSIEYNDNRISLYSGQMGKCAVTGRRLELNEIHCHHKKPRSLGGDDSYSNLKIIHVEVHRLIHATTEETIRKLLETLKLTDYQIGRINNLRKLCELNLIEQI